MATAVENLATIEATLARLYAKDARSISQKDRGITFQEIKTLEASRDLYKKEIAQQTAPILGALHSI